MADINATDLTEEILSTLSGNEQFVMFDPIEGKRAALSVIANYIAEHGEINGDDIPTIITAIQNELTNLKEDLSDKADQNGVYPDLSAGNITGDFHIDTKPYLYRALRDVASHIGSKAFDTLIGGTVAVNQLQQTITHVNGTVSGITATVDSDGYLSISGTAGANGTLTVEPGIATILANHVVMLQIDGNIDFKWGRNGFALTQTGEYLLSKHTANFSCVMAISLTSGSTYDSKFRLIVIDLTQLFASDPTIADRAYTLEQGQAGSGIAWLKSYGFLTKDYYPYNAGALASVLTTGKKVVGFNQFDKDATFLSGYCDGSNRYIEDNRMKSAVVPVISGATYYLNTGSKNGGMQRVAFLKSYPSQHDTIYQGDGALGYIQYTNGTTVTNSKGFPYMIVTFFRNDVTHDDYDDVIGSLCINLSKPTGSPKNGDYLPYESVSYPLDNVELRGVAKLVGNEIKSDGDIYEANGTVTRKYGYRAYEAGDESLANAITDGTHTVYKLNTPTTETADPFTSPQQVFADGTEEYIDTRTVPVPVGHETKYELDLASKLIGLPWDLSMLAPIENGTTASQAYAAGKYFVRNNEFCKAKTSIASGATFTLGTNYEVTTVGAELFALA